MAQKYVAPSQVFQYLLQQGVSAPAAAGILANIEAESSFYSDAVGDGGTSGGLFQHHKSRWTSLKQYADATGRAWDDWTAQVDFALQEARNMGADLAATDADEFSRWWTVEFERPADMYTKADQRAANVSKYLAIGSSSTELPLDMLQQSEGGSTGGSYSGSGFNPGFAPGGNGGPLPAGYALYKDSNTGKQYAVYDFDPGGGAATKIYFEVADPATVYGQAHEVEFGSVASTNGWVDAGSSFELEGETMPWDEIIRRTLMDAGFYGSDALSDQGVVQAIAGFLGQNVDPAVIQNRLRYTDWWKNHTDAQRAWNDKSPAQQNQDVITKASEIATLWFTYAGRNIDIGTFDFNGDGTVTVDELRRGNPQLYKAAQEVASGAKTQVQIVNEMIKPEAMQNDNSPWMRTLRAEEQAQGKFQVDIARMAGDAMDLYNRYGIQMDLAEAKKIGENLAMNRISIEDVAEQVKDMASALYPNKPREIDTLTYSQPYRMAFQQLLESPDPGLYDQMVQKAMAEGTSLGDFRLQLRQDKRWEKTQNARDEYQQQFARIGQMMGF